MRDGSNDIWRLYVREWVIVHTVTMTAADHKPALEAATAWANENLTGVDANDIKYQLNDDTQLLHWVHILVFKDNLKGEFKHYSGAEAYAARMGYEEYVTVPRNSRADNDIRASGVRPS